MVDVAPEFRDLLTGDYVTGSVSVGTSQVEAKVGGSPLAQRELLYIENRGPLPVFYGPTGVTTSTGAQLAKNQFIFLAHNEDRPVFLISTLAGQTVIVQEWS